MNRMVITGCRLEPVTSVYRPILGQRGRFWFAVLGLQIAVQGEEFRFFVGEAVIPTDREVRERLNEALTATLQRAATDAERAAAEAERADAAEARVRDLEARLAALLADQIPS